MIVQIKSIKTNKTKTLNLYKVSNSRAYFIFNYFAESIKYEITLKN